VHRLFCNCLECGRIVCELEAAELCAACSRPLYTHGARSTNERMSAEAVRQARQRAVDEELARLDPAAAGHGAASAVAGTPGGAADADAAAEERLRLVSALRLRDQLLEFDRSSAQRTKVFDDHADYFAASESVWLSAQEREAAAVIAQEREAKRREDDRGVGAARGVKIALDFTGRAVALRDEQSEADRRRRDGLLAAAGLAPSAGSAPGSGGPGSGELMLEAVRSKAQQLARDRQEQAAQAGRLGLTKASAQVGPGLGTGRFHNDTITAASPGRALEVYTYIMQQAKAEAEAKGRHVSAVGGKKAGNGKRPALAVGPEVAASE
jgi:hypothetical protein